MEQSVFHISTHEIRATIVQKDNQILKIAKNGLKSNIYYPLKLGKSRLRAPIKLYRCKIIILDKLAKNFSNF